MKALGLPEIIGANDAGVPYARTVARFPEEALYGYGVAPQPLSQYLKRGSPVLRVLGAVDLGRSSLADPL
jgi:hypothetical protein